MNRIIYSGFCGRVQDRVRSRQGATLVFAIAVFLVASVFSLVIVQESSARAVEAYASRDKEQAYLAVQSAANLLQDALGTDTVTFYRPIKYTYDTDGTLTGANYDSFTSDVTNDIFKNAFANALNNNTSTLKLKAVNLSGKEIIPAVTLELKRQTNDDVEITFSVTVNTSSEPKLQLTAKLTNYQENDAHDRLVYTWTWGTPQILS